MLTIENKTYFTTLEVKETLNRSTEAIRQLIYRKKLKPRNVAGRLYFETEEILNYYPAIIGLPRLDKAPGYGSEKFYSEEEVVKMLAVSKYYLRAPIKQGKIEAYVSSEGQIFISESAFNKYIEGTQTHDAANEI